MLQQDKYKKMILDNAVSELTEKGAAAFVLCGTLYSIFKSESNDGFMVNLWLVDELDSTVDCDDGGLCTGAEIDAVTFCIPEEEHLRYKQSREVQDDEPYLDIPIDDMYELIIENDCFTIEDGAMLYNINNGSTDGEEDPENKHLIEATWDEDDSECELSVVFSEVKEIKFDKKWGIYKIYLHRDDEPIDLKILTTTTVEPKGYTHDRK